MQVQNALHPLAPTAVLNLERPFLDWYLMPESFSAPLVEDAIQTYQLEPGQTVLDPFSGTGTTVLTAVLKGLNGVGIEVNPFLCFAARVKSRFEYNLDELKADIQQTLEQAEPRLAHLNLNLPLFLLGTEAWEEGEAYRTRPVPQMPRLYEWMAERVVNKVLALKECINQIREPAHRDFCLLALAAILRPASNMKLSPHAFGSRQVKEDAPVYEMFLTQVRKMYDDLETVQDTPKGITCILEGDVRLAESMSCPLVPVDLAVTSPPYLNNLDYTMQTRMELFFLDFVKSMDELRELRKKMVVCDAKAMYKDTKDHELVQAFPSVQHVVEQLKERHKNKNWGWDYAFMTAQYFGGMYRMLKSVKALLKPGARYWLVLGESAHSGVFVPVPDIIGELGESVGYQLEEIRTLRTRHSSSHTFNLRESTVVLRV